ncbi:MAG: PP-loop family protein [Desulfovibrio sp.]|nr:PP-loop family protein [Desulfovibrio sp.]
MAVMLSGGVDSRLLCHLAQLCGCDVLALHALGPHLSPDETAHAVEWAAVRGLALHTVAVDVLTAPQVAVNGRERCYACKKTLIAAFRDALFSLGEGERVLCDGTNADDAAVYRPGSRALAEGGVRSPLQEAGLTKAGIRALAAATGLDEPGQKARPCLLTRLAYGLPPDTETLERIARAEAAVGRVFADFGVNRDYRLRLAPEPLLQVQSLPGDAPGPADVCAEAERALDARLCEALAGEGFPQCPIVRTASVSGYFDVP